MSHQTVRPTDDEITNTVKTYSDLLYKLCFTMLCSSSEAEDAVSDTFFRYLTKSPEFKDSEHMKAWLLRTAANICKDRLRFRARHTYLDIADAVGVFAEEKDRSIMEALLRLQDKYKSVIHLHYIEGYKTNEISEILEISPSAVRKRLQYGREMLKKEYSKEFEL